MLKPYGGLPTLFVLVLITAAGPTAAQHPSMDASGVAEAPLQDPERVPREAREDLHTGFLPGGLLFQPLIADPRWPHFAAAYQYYLHDRTLRHAGAVSFGETFTLYRDTLGDGIRVAHETTTPFSDCTALVCAYDLPSAPMRAASARQKRGGGRWPRRGEKVAL